MIFITNEQKDYDDKQNDSPSSSSFLAPTDSKQRILQILLDGPKSLGDITKELKIQKSAVRNHLESLKTEKIVESQFKIERLGRPRKIYQLTGNGRELSFPRKYDLMLSLIISKIIQTSGEVQVRKIIEDIADDMASKIKSEISKRNDSRSGNVQRIE